MKILKNLKYFLICFFVIIFEVTVGKYLEISGTVPMLSLCLCLVIGTKEENFNYIVTIGIIMGLFADLFSGHGFGTYTVAYTLAVTATYIVRDNIFSSALLFLICDTFILTLLLSVFYYLFHILNVGIGFGVMLTGLALPTALYNVVVSAIFYAILNFTLYKRR